MLTYGFYNSINGDRKYDAEQLSSIFEGIVQDGVFISVGNKLTVSALTGMNISVATGRAWFNKTWTNNDAPLALTVQPSEIVYNRIDTVVLEINTDDSVRANSIKIIKGTPAASPVAPTLTNTETIHQYPLCDIYVGVGVTQILSGNLTNRIGSLACPYCTGIIEGIDLVALEAQADKSTTDILIINTTYMCTGTANALVVDTAGVFDLTKDGNILNIIPCSTNTGSATIAVDGQSAKTIKKFNLTSNLYENIAAEDISKNQQFSVRWDITNNCFALVVNKLQLASQTEAETGTDDVKYTTPLKVKQSITKNAVIRYLKTVAPTASNNTTQGYKYGDFWNDTVNQNIYYYLGDDEYGAVWLNMNTAKKIFFFNDGVWGGGISAFSLAQEYDQYGNVTASWTLSGSELQITQYNTAASTQGQVALVSNNTIDPKTFKKIYFRCRNTINSGSNTWTQLNVGVGTTTNNTSLTAETDTNAAFTSTVKMVDLSGLTAPQYIKIVQLIQGSTAVNLTSGVTEIWGE